jgi:1-acyl-sn-glycerol-3-phosphate acyltransferase
MSIAYTVITSSIKEITRILCDIDDAELIKVPQEGPLILISNHINFIEVPILYTHLQPRKITGFVKTETWENPFMGLLFNLWDGIPINRDAPDSVAFRSALDALQHDKFVAVAPEGTRSRHGILQQGHPGVIMLAHMSKVPILPIAYYGGERIKENLGKLKRTDFHNRVGRKFLLAFPEGKINHEVRAKMVDEMMFQLAELLPPEYQGYYADHSRCSSNYILFV